MPGRRSRGRRHRGGARRRRDAEPLLVHPRWCRPSSCIRSPSRSPCAARRIPCAPAPPRRGRSMQVGQFELRVVLHRPGDDGIAGDIGVGAPEQHRLHRIGLGAEGSRPSSRSCPRARAPSSRRPSPCSPTRLALEVLELRDFGRALLDEELELGPEIALGEQHVLGALRGHRGRRARNRRPGLQRRDEAGELRASITIWRFSRLAISVARSTWKP